jgi:hypothetical protein
MDQISITYEDILNLPDWVAGRIVDVQGNCTDLNICLACPFAKECFKNIKDNSRFLDKQTRLRKAEEFLFNKALESEIG